ncbi:MAG: carboxymuconolactone decarboxylase family protein [Gammaproteobacteria bacterium]
MFSSTRGGGRGVRAFGVSRFMGSEIPAGTEMNHAQCPYCIRGHTELAVNHGATEQEVKEAEAWAKMSAKS